MRKQIEGEREAGRQMAERAEAQLVALDQLEALIAAGEVPTNGVTAGLTIPQPPLKTAILRVLNEDPAATWHRDVLYDEIVRRGWGPGGTKPRNTFTSRLRDLELDGRVKRIDRHHFMSPKNKEEVPAV